MNSPELLPVIFMVLMGLAMLAYVVLDGYDLGVGILLRRADDAQKDVMISSIGPFWDANETWLVLGIGILLVAFPLAHGVILGALYLPVALMLIGLTLRGVAFDFRVKARAHHKPLWNRAFYAGSLLATLAQGFMLGFYIVGFKSTPGGFAFGVLIALALVAGYSLLGATWLLMKTEGELQLRAVRWAQGSLWITAFGIGAVSIVTPQVSDAIFQKWFTPANFLLLSPIPALTALLFFMTDRKLSALRRSTDLSRERHAWVPFAASVGMFVLAFLGLAYSLFPYLVPDQITVWQAASSPEALKVILYGAIVVLPAIVGYTVFSYRVFWGKARELTYD